MPASRRIQPPDSLVPTSATGAQLATRLVLPARLGTVKPGDELLLLTRRMDWADATTSASGTVHQLHRSRRARTATTTPRSRCSCAPGTQPRRRTTAANWRSDEQRHGNALSYLTPDTALTDEFAPGAPYTVNADLASHVVAADQGRATSCSSRIPASPPANLPYLGVVTGYAETDLLRQQSASAATSRQPSHRRRRTYRRCRFRIRSLPSRRPTPRRATRVPAVVRYGFKDVGQLIDPRRDRGERRHRHHDPDQYPGCEHDFHRDSGPGRPRP